MVRKPVKRRTKMMEFMMDNQWICMGLLGSINSAYLALLL